MCKMRRVHFWNFKVSFWTQKMIREASRIIFLICWTAFSLWPSHSGCLGVELNFSKSSNEQMASINLDLDSLVSQISKTSAPKGCSQLSLCICWGVFDILYWMFLFLRTVLEKGPTKSIDTFSFVGFGTIGMRLNSFSWPIDLIFCKVSHSRTYFSTVLPKNYDKIFQT